MAFFTLETEKCKKDKVCSLVCPTNIIRIDEDTKFPYVKEGDERKCIKCGQCISFCPHFACSVATVEKSDILDYEKLPGMESAALLLKSRRTVRHFKKNGLSKDEILRLIDMANCAPTAENNRFVRWVVLSERKCLDRALALILEYWEPLTKTVALVRGVVRHVKNGKDIVFRGAPQLIAAVTPKEYEWHEDGVIALTYLEIAAHSCGVGMCWGGFFVEAARNYAPLREYLGIKEDEYICGAQMMGYPSFKAKKAPIKPSPSITIMD